jgi:hypothetical protein
MDDLSNGARFIRTVNNSVYDVFVKLDVEDGEFWCECDDPGCEERVVLTLREYIALRGRNGEPLLSRSHAPDQAASVTDANSNPAGIDVDGRRYTKHAAHV